MKFQYRKQTSRPLQCDKISTVTFVSVLAYQNLKTNFDLSESRVTVENIKKKKPKQNS